MIASREHADRDRDGLHDRWVVRHPLGNPGRDVDEARENGDQHLADGLLDVAEALLQDLRLAGGGLAHGGGEAADGSVEAGDQLIEVASRVARVGEVDADGLERPALPHHGLAHVLGCGRQVLAGLGGVVRHQRSELRHLVAGETELRERRLRGGELVVVESRLSLDLRVQRPERVDRRVGERRELLIGAAEFGLGLLGFAVRCDAVCGERGDAGDDRGGRDGDAGLDLVEPALVAFCGVADVVESSSGRLPVADDVDRELAR
jgi:hypothetical protein